MSRSSNTYLPLHTTTDQTEDTCLPEQQHSSTTIQISSTTDPQPSSTLPYDPSVLMGRPKPPSEEHQSRPTTWIILFVNFMLFMVFIITSSLPHYAESIHTVDKEMLELRLSAERASNSTLFWGTYRPNLYFGVRPRLPHSVMTGLMWYTLEDHSAFRRKLT
jgi:hypothetical protein